MENDTCPMNDTNETDKIQKAINRHNKIIFYSFIISIFTPFLLLILNLFDVIPYSIIILGIITSIFIYNFQLNFKDASLSIFAMDRPLNNIIETMDISPAKTSIYCLCFANIIIVTISFFSFSFHFLLAIEIFNILILFYLLWLFLNPFSVAISLIANLKHKEHKVEIQPSLNLTGKILLPVTSSLISISKYIKCPFDIRKIESIQAKYFYRKWTYLYEHLTTMKISRAFFLQRQELYGGFFKFKNDNEIVSYLNMKRKEIELSHDFNFDQSNTALKNKLYILYIFLFVMLMNYIAICYGLSSKILAFEGMQGGILKPFYFLITTITTVGYGDITPSNEESIIFISLILVQVLFLVSIVINVVGDLSSLSDAQMVNPFKSYKTFILKEVDNLIYKIETKQFIKEIDSLLEKFSKYQYIIFALKKYKKNHTENDNKEN